MRAKIAIAFLSISLIASFGLSSNQAFGGEFTNECTDDDVPLFDDNCVHAFWDDQNNDLDEIEPASSWFSDSSEFDLFVPSEFGEPSEPIGGCISGACDFRLPNFVDDLNTKKIIVQVSYDSTGSGPIFPSVTCNDSTGTSDGILINTIERRGVTEWEFECSPNPDWEIINFVRSAALEQVVIWTTSFGEPQVGGEFLGVDSTALIVAGAQMNAAWMIPVIVSAIGFAIVIARKF